MKQCIKCRKIKANTFFYKDATKKDGLRNDCKECVLAFQRKEYEKNPEIKKGKANGYYDKNKESVRRASKKYREKNPNYGKEWKDKNQDLVKDSRLKRTYGITLKEYNALLEKQNYKCAICGTEKSENGASFSVDHNHKTGKVRGLLCHSCNVGIGLLKENEDTLLKAITYLRK